MALRLSRAATQAAYGISQLPRVAWYIGHSFLLRELADATREREEPKARRRAHSNSSVPDRKRIYADMAKLFLRDLANVEAGIYPIPADHDGTLFASIHRSRLFFEDLPIIHRRRKRRAHNEILNDNTRGKRPRYYLQNFHYQSGGWMTDDSAELYDTQVEVLFNGSANAVRRSQKLWYLTKWPDQPVRRNAVCNLAVALLLLDPSGRTRASAPPEILER